ncbi:tyrosinase family protein [Massilia sp. S19_KUP03_FR1]|uniref:tyrosinase family protein n=1 Tax=Massilia sp. S19_KUP03_FR1 TaxID=3025503 RepID=UPI002FCDE1E7
MPPLSVRRRAFIRCSALAAAYLNIPRIGFAQSAPYRRVEWQKFKTMPQYASFINAVKKMKANTSAASPSSWAYWTNVHVNYCLHGTSYFLAWHRGYLYYFEQRLRLVSGDNTLCLPYWDYYKYPKIPIEFTDPSATNPLYVPRVNTSVFQALTLSPFASKVKNFQRGTVNAFEPQLETAPHNPVHDLIGGEMANMTSPRDPIFYLHHANIDRLWQAWALSGGKSMPVTSNPYNAAVSASYWANSFTYASDLTLPRYKTYDPAWLNVSYADLTLPTYLPPSARATPDSPIRRVQTQSLAVLTRPPVGNFATTSARPISATRRALGGVSGMVLTDVPVSGHLRLSASSLQSLQDALSVAVGPSARTSPQSFRSVVVVMDQIQVLSGGKNGGYFYHIYLNLPYVTDAIGAQKYFLGTVGPFEIAAASHHGAATLEYQATEVLSRLSVFELQEVTISLLQVGGDNAPRGAVVKIGEVRIDISTVAPWDSGPSTQEKYSDYGLTD